MKDSVWILIVALEINIQGGNEERLGWWMGNGKRNIFFFSYTISCPPKVLTVH